MFKDALISKGKTTKTNLMPIICKDIENNSTEMSQKNTINLTLVMDTMPNPNTDNKINTKAKLVLTTNQEDKT